MALIDLQDLTFRYPGAAEATLTDLHLRVVDGEAHALLGASGAGKTTLLNLLSGILKPTNGRILFDGVDVSDWSGRQRGVTQVFQFPVLYESLSVADNLVFPLRTRKASRTLIAARLQIIGDELALGPLLERKPRELSLFEKQLVALGKALMHPDIKVVLLDEPLTAVEPRIKWRLRQSIKRVQADLGVTMIYVTHDQTEALTFADRVSVLTTDGILQTGTPQEIYQAPQHEFVGHFVGSPGMNFVPAAALGLDDCEQLGFRAEWAELDTHATLRGSVRRVRLQGTRDGHVYGVVTLDSAHGELNVRATMREAPRPGQELGVRVQRYVGFTNRQQVTTGEFA